MTLFFQSVYIMMEVFVLEKDHIMSILKYIHKNCFHQENRKLRWCDHVLLCMGAVKIWNGVDITFGAFVCLINNIKFENIIL